MEIVAALFIENINLRQLYDGGPTQIDLSGIHFSLPAPQPVPVTITPHLVVLVRCPVDHGGQGTLETSFRDASGKEVARNAQPLQVEPGKFRYSLVRGELTYDDYGTIEAHCRIDTGHTTIVPLALLPPVEAGE
jgi:hypothetical protein